MATIDQLLNKIQNPELKAKLQLEVNRLQKQKRFGLVFEDHLPEAQKKTIYEQEKQNHSSCCDDCRSRITNIRARQRTCRYKQGNKLYISLL